jgi:hypothetical protein
MYQPTANFALPASREENRVKSNRLPIQTRLYPSRGQITDWWQQAWNSKDERQRFFVKGALSLSNIGQYCSDFYAVLTLCNFSLWGLSRVCG